MAYPIVPNHVELDQLVLRVERQPDTVQMNHTDWGFRFTNLFGIDYRYTIADGYFSNQLLAQNNLYGYDPIEAYGQLYFPSVAQGMVLTFGRYLTPVDIESQLSNGNYLVTHSLMFTYDAVTQTGVNAQIMFDKMWSLQIGLNSGDDVAPWTNTDSFPTLLALVRWVSSDNNNSLLGGVTSFNGQKFKANYENLQEFNLTWSHRFTEGFFTETELYYIYQIDAAMGGSCNFGPVKSFGGGGGGCGPIIPGRSSSIGVVNYLEYKLSEKSFASFRTDYLDDPQGQLTRYATSYMSWTLGLTNYVTNQIAIQPEVRYETALNNHVTPYDNGTRKNQTLFVIAALISF